MFLHNVSSLSSDLTVECCFLSKTWLFSVRNHSAMFVPAIFSGWSPPPELCPLVQRLHDPCPSDCSWAHAWVPLSLTTRQITDSTEAHRFSDCVICCSWLEKASRGHLPNSALSDITKWPGTCFRGSVHTEAHRKHHKAGIKSRIYHSCFKLCLFSLPLQRGSQPLKPWSTFPPLLYPRISYVE